jgi:hypothetical protein
MRASSIGSWAVLSLSSLALTACPVGPSSVSFAKYVHETHQIDPEHAPSAATGAFTGKLSVSGGPILAFQTSPSRTTFAAMPVEADLSVWISSHVDLVATAAYGYLGTEGDLWVFQSRSTRVGVLLGVGLAATANSPPNGGTGSWTVDAYPDASVGVFVQFATQGARAAFAGVRYTYATVAQSPSSTTGPNPRHYGVASIGYVFPVGKLRLAPEFLVGYFIDAVPNASGNWAFSPILNASVPF